MQKHYRIYAANPSPNPEIRVYVSMAADPESALFLVQQGSSSSSEEVFSPAEYASKFGEAWREGQRYEVWEDGALVISR